MKQLTNISLTLLMLLLMAANGMGQNLVPNPSFEDTSYCVTGPGDVSAAMGWEPYADTPDYFNTCTSDYYSSVPNNWGGYQQAATGNGYAAFGTYSSYFGQVNGREFIGRSLSNPLVIGTKYYVSLKISLSISDTIWANCATNNIGAMFSTVPYQWSSNPAPVTNNPQVYTNTIVTDTLDWTTITGSFIADSAYQYIMLGNFFDDTNTDTLIVSGNPNEHCFSYYYIDDICVSTDSLDCNQSVGFNEIALNESSFNIFPNPLTDFLNIEYSLLNEPYDLSIFNTVGQLLFNEKNINNKNIRINTTSFNSGLLLINIKSKNQNFYYKLIKN